jgi:two-component system, cell cycle response regulator DivK
MVTTDTPSPNIVDEKTVLLVEDNEDNQIVYSTVLRHFGYRVLVAGDGATGIRLARERRPDIILMDVSIPIIDGWEATRTLKADVTTRPIPIVALTAHALVTDRVKAFEAGCDEYLSKPAEPRLVLETVRRMLSNIPKV